MDCVSYNVSKWNSLLSSNFFLLQPKYIENLLKKAEQRQREQDIVYERKLAKERSQEDHLYADKDKFVTSAYKKKLAEQAKWLEEERRRELREEKDDVCILTLFAESLISYFLCLIVALLKLVEEKKWMPLWLVCGCLWHIIDSMAFCHSFSLDLCLIC